MSDSEPIMSERVGRERRSGAVLRILGIGCGVVAVIAVGVGIFVGLHAREWAGDAARTLLVSGIEASRLSDPQKVALTQRADRLTEDFKAKQITLEQLVAIGEGIAEGPIFNLAILMAVESGAVLDAGLEVAQRDSASLEFQRYYRGVVEGSISASELDLLVSPYFDDPDPEAMEGIGTDVSDAERDALIDAMRSRADSAGVPAESYEIDFAALFDEVVARALGR